MADLTAAALRLAIRQHGAITTAQLVASGVSRKSARRLVAHGSLIHVAKSVYRLPTDGRTLEQRCAELCLAHPRVFVTGPTAGVLMGLRRMPARSRITLSSPHPLHLELRDVHLRRTTKFQSSDIVRRDDGITIASPARLAFDLAAPLSEHAHRSVLDQLLHEHGVAPAALQQTARRLCHPARPGSGAFLRSLVDVTEGPSESEAERRVAEALRARSVPVQSNRQWLELPGGGRARLDLAVPAVRWGVEIDVHPSHLGLAGSTADKRRDRQAALLGWQIHRVTAIDLLDLAPVADELSALYRRRVAEIAA